MIFVNTISFFYMLLDISLFFYRFYKGESNFKGEVNFRTGTYYKNQLIGFIKYLGVHELDEL